MELRQLSYFVAVAEELSFTRAAERVRIVQSGVSVAVRALERELGAELFDRSSSPIRMTEAGEALLPLARETLASVAAAREAVAETVGGMRGTVRLGHIKYPYVIDLGEVIASFARTNPGVEIVPVTATDGSAALVEMVTNGVLDAAVVTLPDGYPASVVAHHLGAQETFLACRDDHPLARRRSVSFADLHGVAFIAFPDGFGVQRSVDQLALAAGIQLDEVARVPDPALVSVMVGAGMGVAFLTEQMVAHTPRVRLVPVDPGPAFDVALIHPRDRRMSAATGCLVDHVLELSRRGDDSD
jgi:DNA-binding transcriptional LysR family regulator